jgi:hypothetical protein
MPASLADDFPSENNQPDIVARRRDLLLQIKALSLRMEVLHQAKENYQLHRIVPDTEVLWLDPAVSPGSPSRDKPLRMIRWSFEAEKKPADLQREG